MFFRLPATSHQPPAYLQQSPGQQPAPCPQQLLVPQQAPGQQLAPFVQHAAPVNAIAESDRSDIAKTVINLLFMGISFPCEKCVNLRNREKARANTERFRFEDRL
jgi:hypothetical protein